MPRTRDTVARSPQPFVEHGQGFEVVLWMVVPRIQIGTIVPDGRRHDSRHQSPHEDFPGPCGLVRRISWHAALTRIEHQVRGEALVGAPSRNMLLQPFRVMVRSVRPEGFAPSRTAPFSKASSALLDVLSSLGWKRWCERRRAPFFSWRNGCDAHCKTSS